MRRSSKSEKLDSSTQNYLYILVGELAEVYNKFSNIVLHETLKTLMGGDIDVIRYANLVPELLRCPI